MIVQSDGCPVESRDLSVEYNVSVPWQETEISEEVMVQCPCGSLNASVHGGRTLSRRCGGSYTYGAEWGEVTDDCTFSSTTFQLCNITTVRHIYHSFPDTALSQTTGLRQNSVVINACTSHLPLHTHPKNSRLTSPSRQELWHKPLKTLPPSPPSTSP